MGQSLKTTPSITEEATTALRETCSRVNPFAAAREVWVKLLSPEDRKRLGNDVEKAHQVHRGTVGMWMHLRGVTFRRSVIELGKKLQCLSPEAGEWLLREIGESTDDSEAMVEQAVRTGALVLTERPREAYWNSGRIEIDWENKPTLWNFLWELSVHAKGGRSIDRLTFGERKNFSYASKTKSRLVNQEGFPCELDVLINPAGRGSLKLTLPPNRIRIFQISPNGSLRELTS